MSRSRKTAHVGADLAEDGFGNTVSSTGSSSDPYMYAATSGYRNDGDAGLSHVGARYYDAQVGRFTSRDTDLDEVPYLYCDHDPINHLDPSGHVSVDFIMSTKGIWGRFGVAAIGCQIVQAFVPKGSFVYKVVGTIGDVSIIFSGISLIGGGIPALGTPITALGGAGSIILGGVFVTYGLYDINKLWSE